MTLLPKYDIFAQVFTELNLSRLGIPNDVKDVTIDNVVTSKKSIKITILTDLQINPLFEDQLYDVLHMITNQNQAIDLVFELTIKRIYFKEYLNEPEKTIKKEEEDFVINLKNNLKTTLQSVNECKFKTKLMYITFSLKLEKLIKHTDNLVFEKNDQEKVSFYEKSNNAILNQAEKSVLRLSKKYSFKINVEILKINTKTSLFTLNLLKDKYKHLVCVSKETEKRLDEMKIERKNQNNMRKQKSVLKFKSKPMKNNKNDTL